MGRSAVDSYTFVEDSLLISLTCDFVYVCMYTFLYMCVNVCVYVHIHQRSGVFLSHFPSLVF